IRIGEARLSVRAWSLISCCQILKSPSGIKPARTFSENLFARNLAEEIFHDGKKPEEESKAGAWRVRDGWADFEGGILFGTIKAAARVLNPSQNRCGFAQAL